MKTFDVYHRKEPDFMGRETVYDESLYEKVAVVECDGLGTVFLLTNHINCAWWKKDGIKWHKPDSRSTSVGDVVIETTAGNDFQPMIVGQIGWRRLEFTEKEVI